LLRTIGAAFALVATAALSGCTSGTNGSNANPGYVSPDGTVKVIAVNDRNPAPPVRGRSLDGGTYDVRDRAGDVVVVNFWASWCPPCRAEQPRLNDVYAAVRGKNVDFVGVDLRDEDAMARAFRRTHTVAYPSIVDESGTLLLGFRDIPASPPSTVVIDRFGRIAAKIIGQTPKGVLQPIVEQLLAESTSAS
jgi:thiol-disulfide isomerase/thioredoxin